MYNVNENLAQGISKQKIADGDVIEFGGTACGNIDDYEPFPYHLDIPSPISSQREVAKFPL